MPVSLNDEIGLTGNTYALIGAGLVVDICVPQLENRSCGDNGCGVSVGTCNSNQECINYQCVDKKSNNNYLWVVVLIIIVGIGYYLRRKK